MSDGRQTIETGSFRKGLGLDARGAAASTRQPQAVPWTPQLSDPNVSRSIQRIMSNVVWLQAKPQRRAHSAARWGHEPVIGQPIGTIATKALSAPTVSRGLQRSATLGKDTYLRDSVNPTKSGDSKR